jgi:hypothetical protein
MAWAKPARRVAMEEAIAGRQNRAASAEATIVIADID